MITYRLTQLSTEFEYLAKDLRSNDITDTALNNDLADLTERIQSLQNDRIAALRSKLNKLADRSAPAPRSVTTVRRDVRHVVRRLAVLLLEAGVRHATEVFTTRLEDITERQARVMNASMQPTKTASAEQRRIVAENEESTAEMQHLQNPLDNPLAAVRLARTRKIIEGGNTANLLTKAAKALKKGKTDPASRRQAKAVDALRQARDKLRSEAASEKRQNVRKRRVVATSRLDRLRAYQDRQLDFVENLAETKPGDPDFDTVVSMGKRQLDDLRGLMDALPEDDKWTPAVRAALTEAVTAMDHASSKLKADEIDAALRESRTAIGPLRQAANRLQKKVNMLEDIDTHLELAEDMRYVSRSLADVEAEQDDLSQRPNPAGDPDNKTQRVLAAALGELRETVSGVSQAAAVDRPMEEGRKAMNAVIEKKKLPPSKRNQLQTQAKNHVQKAGTRAEALARRAEYVAQWLAYLGKRHAAALNLLARQIELRKRTERDPERLFGEIKGEQKILLSEAERYAENIEMGRSHYVKAATEMEKAMTQIKNVNRAPAVTHQRRAVKALRKAAEALAELLGNVAEITNIGRMEYRESDTHILTRIMMVAVEQRRIRKRTGEATEEQLREFTRREQLHLMRTTRKLASHEDLALYPQVDSLPQAADTMEKAADQLDEKVNRSKAVEHQQQAEQALRADIAAMVSELLSTIETMPAQETEGGGGRALKQSVAMPMESIRVFGEAPTTQPTKVSGSQKSTWEPLGPRQRAALNENFARELPLEYRGLLKRYYQSLAE